MFRKEKSIAVNSDSPPHLYEAFSFPHMVFIFKHPTGLNWLDGVKNPSRSVVCETWWVFRPAASHQQPCSNLFVPISDASFELKELVITTSPCLNS